MSKIRLTESQLHKVIKESVKKVLRELDYKTYQNAAKKAHLRALDDYDDNDTNMNKYLEKSKNFRNAAEDAFIRDYGYDDGQYHTKMHSDMHGSNTQAPGGGYFPYHDDSSLRIYDRNDKFNIFGMPHERSVARDDYMYDRNDIPFDATDLPNNARDKFLDADIELKNYKRGNYEYQKGKGWQLKR